MEVTQRILLSTDAAEIPMTGFDVCCDECGGLCRDMLDMLTPTEQRAFFAEYQKARMALAQANGLGA
jgi:hypothetical protein